ncbi:FKBP-type peptidyl-prolyl cis-trans isomerase [Arcicella sp. LKC2W]|uniref:FKBP-type peptidyl-prolyl cis-trans isomerase n=1 Tax=Arcicella sp. LKC2W TaxID=2984198 RepID=UPI002B218065|nr:FKBP-type peptidyl-prolyl cis-trans isomerase [Arcicella sp. LKC2W]MEA5458898.1 FKBP-type peptidyl-prolyl cis-trans isomerase [Arcicella sp. LKC2W]
MYKISLFFVFIFSVFLVACNSDNEALGPEEDQIKNYIKAKKLVVTDSSTTGLYFILTKANPSGAVLQNSQTVTVNYVGKFIAGKKMDSEFDSGNFSFMLGQQQVVEGFDKGIAKMRVGEKATIIFPSSMGYGSSGAGSISANTPLLFEIEVVSAK